MEAYPPRCKKGLRSFYWMYNVYRRFVKDYAQVAQPLAAMMSCKRPDWFRRCLGGVQGAQEATEGGTHPSSLYRGAWGPTRWTRTQVRDESARSYCRNSPSNPLGPWPFGAALLTRRSATTIRRSESALRWCGHPFSFVSMSRRLASRYARTMRRLSGCYTWTGPS